MNKIAIVALLIILIIVNFSIAEKEQHLKDGQVVYLKLAPVDPRSLMQGDYMALRFELARKISNAMHSSDSSLKTADGLLITTLDKQNIASFKAIYIDQKLAVDEVLLRFRIRNGKIKFATNAFFFQEGKAKLYQSAKFGQFRVDDNGEMLLIAMYDEQMKLLGISTDKTF